MGNRVRHDHDMLDGWIVAGAFELAEQGAPRFFPPFQRLLWVAPREDEPRVVGAPAPPLRLRPETNRKTAPGIGTSHLRRRKPCCRDGTALSGRDSGHSRGTLPGADPASGRFRLLTNRTRGSRPRTRLARTPGPARSPRPPSPRPRCPHRRRSPAKAREGGAPTGRTGPGVFRPKRNAERSEAEWFSRGPHRENWGSPVEPLPGELGRVGFATGCYAPLQGRLSPVGLGAANLALGLGRSPLAVVDIGKDEVAEGRHLRLGFEGQAAQRRLFRLP